MAQDEKKENLNPDYFSIKLKGAEVLVDGFTIKTLAALETDGISISNLQPELEKRPINTLSKIFYYMAKLSTQTDKYRNMQYSEFLDLMLIDSIEYYSNQIKAMTEKSFSKYVENEKSSDSKKK